MPVFFYIDPEFATDPKMNGINIITLRWVHGACIVLPVCRVSQSLLLFSLPPPPVLPIHPPLPTLPCSYTFFKVAEEEWNEEEEAAAAAPAAVLPVTATAGQS